MNVFGAFLLNIALYSIFPLYLTTIKSSSRSSLFYIYISAMLVFGSLLGSIYSFELADGIIISGGSVAFGAFMMSTTMLLIIERNVSVLRNMVKLVLLVDGIIFLGFKLFTWLLSAELVINHLNISVDIFHISLTIILTGGIIILIELLLLLFLFIQVRKVIFNISLLASVYTAAFIFILCLDGLLFPLLAMTFKVDLGEVILGSVAGKFVLAMSYSLPMLIFYWVFKRHLIGFLKSPLRLQELMTAPRKKLLEEIQRYEVQDKELRQANSELLQQSTHDSLTSLANRRKFDHTLSIEWKRCQRSGKPLTLVIGDIDFFKQYNDLYGHQRGDICLASVAALWGNCFSRPSDLAARIGGEEFAIILPETTAIQCHSGLNLFVNNLKIEDIHHKNSSVAEHVTMSIGVATLIPNKELTCKDLVELADKNLYKAKNQGRNRIVYSDQLGKKAATF
ncbi:GGDEF domain-containing protein [Paraglaciecola sp. 2405UD69-4]|uniref:GGDEF domain-containing protein n=1 Tax=Paraglaciecola sp. 2405UD69-4 TaxID=3391836 RepID=UPI0039C8ED38